MNIYNTIRFGLGEVISDRAKVGTDPWYPAVTLEPALENPGIVGTRGPDEPLTELRDGSTVLEFHGAEGAKILIEDIALSLLGKGHNLSDFLRQMATKLDNGQKA
jgi:hypothetical protein